MKGTKLPLYALMTLLSSTSTYEETDKLPVDTVKAQSIEVPLQPLPVIFSPPVSATYIYPDPTIYSLTEIPKVR